LPALVTYASCKTLHYDENKTHAHTQIKIDIERGIETKIMIR